jgi:hypothetical protein
VSIKLEAVQTSVAAVIQSNIENVVAVKVATVAERKEK